MTEQEQPTTFEQTRDDNLMEQQERYEELASRDMLARSYAILRARGTFDPAKHGPGDTEPLTLAERLELIARGEALARHYRHPSTVHNAVLAGATPEQIAAANGTDEATVRREYRAWADGQHSLWHHYEGQFGLNQAEYDAACAWSDSGDAGEAGA